MITLSFYGWIIPLAVTALSFMVASFLGRRSGGYAAGIAQAIFFIIALIISLIAWMIYGLVT